MDLYMRGVGGSSVSAIVLGDRSGVEEELSGCWCVASVLVTELA